MGAKTHVEDSPLGFGYSPCSFTTDAPRDIRAVCFQVRKVLEGIVYDTVALEDNPFTLPEVKALIEGVTVGGHKVSDANQVLNQAASWRALLSQVEERRFVLTAENACALHTLVAHEEALSWGAFRTGAVTIAGTDHEPPESGELPGRWAEGERTLRSIGNVHERAFATFLFVALHQFFYDGNKRTGRLLMNGELLSAGHAAVTIPAARKTEFNRKMIRFYDTREGDEMLQFLASCSLDRGLRLHPSPDGALL